MRRLRILSGIALLVVTFFLATASSLTNGAPKTEVAMASANEIRFENKQTEIREKRQQQLLEALNAYFNRAIQAGDIIGAGLSIVKGDELVITEGFGKRSLNAKAEVDGQTVFRLGSLSKGFTGVLAAQLKAEGRLSWNDRITDYIPDFALGTKENTAKIKLRHILSHTSGTPYHSYTNLVEAGLSMAAIAKRFDEVKPISEPGLQYSYQNAMFSLSQEVMRKATGQDTKTLLRNRFFRPLGMTTVSMNHKDLLESDNVALPHSRSRSRGWRTLPLRDRYYNAVAAGGINASSSDMAKWMRFVLGHNPEVMTKNAIQEVFTPVIAINNHRKYYQRWPGHLQSAYGYGWRIHQFKANTAAKEMTVWHHGGSVNNFRNEIALFPDADMGICVLLNGNSKIAQRVIPDLYALVENSYNINSIQSYTEKHVND